MLDTTGLRFKVVAHAFVMPQCVDGDLHTSIRIITESARYGGQMCSDATARRAMQWAIEMGFCTKSTFFPVFKPRPQQWFWDPDAEELRPDRFFDDLSMEKLEVYIQLAENTMINCANANKPLRSQVWGARLELARYELSLRAGNAV